MKTLQPPCVDTREFATDNVRYRRALAIRAIREARFVAAFPTAEAQRAFAMREARYIGLLK